MENLSSLRMIMNMLLAKIILFKFNLFNILAVFLSLINLNLFIVVDYNGLYINLTIINCKN